MIWVCSSHMAMHRIITRIAPTATTRPPRRSARSWSPAPRVREMMAVVVSVANQCEYCQEHHLEALRHYWKDEARLNQLVQDFYQLELNRGEIALCELARKLTVNPESVHAHEEMYIQPLREAGFSDRAILDATMIISYFNFVNRLVLGLGVEPDQEEVRGYNY